MTDISKANWQANRPSDLKDTGMGGAADKWKSTCVDVKKLKDSVALADAGTKNKDLIAALENSRKLLEKLKKSNKYIPTKALLDDWETQAKAYAASLATESMDRIKAEAQRIAKANKLKADLAEETLRINTAKVNKIADDAIELTKESQSTLTEYKSDIKNKVAALQMLVTKAKAKGDPDGRMLSSVGLLVKSAGEINDGAQNLIVSLRKDVGSGGVAPLRRGGVILAREHDLDAAGTKALVDKYNQHKGLMDKFELDVKTVGLLFQQVEVDSTAVEQLLKKGKELTAGYQKILERVLDQVIKMKSEMGAIKSPTTKTWNIDKPPGSELNIVEQQIVVQVQVLEKWRKAKKRLDELVATGVGYVPKESHADPGLKTLIANINNEAERFSDSKKSIDKEYGEANDHLQLLVDQLKK